MEEEYFGRGRIKSSKMKLTDGNFTRYFNVGGFLQPYDYNKREERSDKKTHKFMLDNFKKLKNRMECHLFEVEAKIIITIITHLFF